MSGPTVNAALRDRFDAIRAAELERLQRKLRGLSDDDRASIEAIAADVVRAIACIPERALTGDVPARTLEALIHVFALDVAHGRAA